MAITRMPAPAVPVYRSKKDSVLDALRAAILSGEIKPGQRLVIDELASHYGISAIPVREALQQLQADGLVTIQPHVGATVTLIEPNLVNEIFDLLEAFELLSTRRACERMTAADYAQVEALLAEMDGAMDDLDRWSAMNARLHLFICDCAGMALAKSMLAKVLDHWNRLRKVYLIQVHSKRVHQSQKEHWQMLRAMKAKDFARLDAVVREHNRAARDAYTSRLPPALGADAAKERAQ